MLFAAAQPAIRPRSTADFSRASSSGADLIKLSPQMRANIKVHNVGYIQADNYAVIT